MARIYGVPKQLGPRGAVGSGIRIVGIPEAVAKLKGVESVVRLNLGQLTSGAASFMESRAKEYVPEITGNLKSGIKREHVGAYSWAVSASSKDGGIPEKNSKEYAGFVEFGTSKMAPRFFMTRAWHETYPLAVEELKVLAKKIEHL